MISASQFSNIKWGDPKKATRELCVAVFGRQVLRTHSLTGKTSNAFRHKEAKPQLDPDKVADIIGKPKFREGFLSLLKFALFVYLSGTRHMGFPYVH